VPAHRLKDGPGNADINDVAVTFDLRARPLLVVVLLVAVAAAVGLFVLQRNRGSDDSSAPAATTVAAATAAPKERKANAAPAASKPKPAKPARPVATNQLPVAIRRALAAEQVVVVALYDPNAKIDTTAMREARAGADLAGSAFVPVNVQRNAVASLNARYGVLHDPAVLVLRPPNELFVQIDGFADRDTVAQAAVDAAP
jgi:hypothetical protein